MEGEDNAQKIVVSGGGSNPGSGVPAVGTDQSPAAAAGEQTGFRRFSLNGNDVHQTVLQLIPEESALHYQFVPLGVNDGTLQVGIKDPNNISARRALNFISSRIRMPFEIFIISEEDFADVLKMYKNLSGVVTKALTDLQDELAEEGSSNKKTEKSEIADITVVEDAPITKIVATILRYAVEGQASDVHIEQMSANMRVRFRVDGILNTSLVLPKTVHSAVVARIKILSDMRLDEKRRPQDGRFTSKIDDLQIDFRVSTFPTHFGEKVVMRLLDQNKGLRTLNELGISPTNITVIERAIKKPYGIILISGPTGSGKTSTLYSMLNMLDKEKKNILSLEDPVEYNVEGISQSQINAEIDYTFANGLRTTLRQDPDIIMVGEIRDKETAQLAVQAALTGHLVLSTIHTNNAFGVIPRLIDMDVDPYLIAPTLVLAIAQRLVKRLCPGGGEPVAIEDSIKKIVEKEFQDVPLEIRNKLPLGKPVHKIKPLPTCPQGVKGRVAAMEVLEMDKDLEKIILENPTEIEIEKMARTKGMLSMKQDAILKSINKIVPFEEVANL